MTKAKRKRKHRPPTTLSRDLEYLKPRKFQDHLTIMELSRYVGKDSTWLKRLEREGRIPQAARVQMGQLSIRLWSPEQVQEIVEILAEMKPGRPPGS